MSTIPSSFSLSMYCGPVLDQGNEGSCEENAICGAIVLQAREYGQHIDPLSRQQFYNDVRIAQGTFNIDSGTAPDVGYTVAMTKGIANESSFAYGPANMYVIPPDSVEAEAATQKLLSYTPLNIYQDYSNIAKTIGQQLIDGKVVLASTRNLTLADGEFIQDGHMFIIDGIDYTTGQYDMVNSWGASWGASGHMKINFIDLRPALTDGTAVINGFNGVDVTWSSDRIKIAQLYTSLLERSGENFGITAWASNLHNGTSINDIANAFYGSPEGQALYAGMTDSQYVNQVFHNILNRDADAAGMQLFLSQLAGGETRGALASDIMQYIDSYTGTDAGTIASHDFLENRATVSMNYGVTFQVDGTHHQAAIDSLTGVTSDANTIPVALVGIQHAMGWI